MPAKRSYDLESSAGYRKRATPHISRACDACRRRKMRCDGETPRCTACRERGQDCEFNDEDRRKTHADQLDDLRSRMDRFESLLERLVDDKVGSAPKASHVPPQAVPSRDTRPAPAVSQRPSPLSNVVPVQPSPASGSSRSGGRALAGPINNPTESPLSVLTEDEPLQRVVEEQAAVVHFGATSLWRYSIPRRGDSRPSPRVVRHVQPEDWINWQRNLPPSLAITREVHDRAINHFGAYYASWCVSVDMPDFWDDLKICNRVVTDEDQEPPVRTVHYSPLLHNCVLFLGLYMLRDEYTAPMARFEGVFLQHCAPLIFAESDYAALSSLRAYNLYADCLQFLRHSMQGQQVDRTTNRVQRHSATGYLFSGLAVAGVLVLGLNIDPSSDAGKSDLTDEERHHRDYAFWTVYVQDGIRALASGRQPMLPLVAGVPLLKLDAGMDNFPWTSARRSSDGTGSILDGEASMCATAFLWLIKIVMLAQTGLQAIYSRKGVAEREEVIRKVDSQLTGWYEEMPLKLPEHSPLPHILLLHMQYHLTCIFVNRPAFRLASSAAKCLDSAREILQLLGVFEMAHGVRNAHHNLINVIFGAATVFLLQYVENQSGEGADCFHACVDYMGKLARTWHEASVGREILLSLIAEYTSPQNEQPGAQAMTTDHLQDLQDWLTFQDFSAVLPSDQATLWEDFLGGI